MSKNKIVMCAIGGVALLAALVLGYFIYAAWADRAEKLEELEAAEASVQRINAGKIAPEKRSVEAIEANTRALAIWRSESLAAASRGDRAVDAAVTPEAFKRLLVDEAREEARKPGGVAGCIVKPDFAFGFKDFISGGAMPARDQLPFLQRQWADVKLFTETLSAAGVVELAEVVIAERKAAAPAAASQPKAGAKKSARTRKGAEEEEKPLADAQGYELKFLARPLALVKVVNAFATSDRFIVIDALSCQRADDTLAAVLGGKEKDGARAAAPTGGRGRRRRAAAAEASGDGAEPSGDGAEASGEARRKGLVIDPATDTPFTVTMKLTTYDFGSKTAEAGTDAAGEEAAE